MYIVRNVIRNLCDTVRKHQRRNRSQKAQPGGGISNLERDPTTGDLKDRSRDETRRIPLQGQARQGKQGRAGRAGTGGEKVFAGIYDGSGYPGRDSGGRETLAVFTDILPCSWSTIINCHALVHLARRYPGTQDTERGGDTRREGRDMRRDVTGRGERGVSDYP